MKLFEFAVKTLHIGRQECSEVIVPEMIGSVVGVYNGKNFINVEVKRDVFLKNFRPRQLKTCHFKDGQSIAKRVTYKIPGRSHTVFFSESQSVLAKTFHDQKIIP